VLWEQLLTKKWKNAIYFYSNYNFLNFTIYHEPLNIENVWNIRPCETLFVSVVQSSNEFAKQAKIRLPRGNNCLASYVRARGESPLWSPSGCWLIIIKIFSV